MVGVDIFNPKAALKAAAAALIGGQVLFPDVNGNIIQDSNLFWDNTAKKLKIANLVAGGLLFPDSSGNLIQGSNLTWDNVNFLLTVTNDISGTTVLRVGGDVPLRLAEHTYTYYYDIGRRVADGGFYFNGNQPGSVAFHFQKNGTDVLTIANNENIGIGGATSPTHTLQLGNDDAAKTTTNTWTVTSDKRLKKNIVPFMDGLSKLLQLNPIEFDFTGDGGTPKDEHGIGMIGQDIEAITPYMVRKTKGKIKQTDVSDTDIYGVNNHALVYILVNAVKDLSAQVTTLKNRLAAAGIP